MKKLLTLVLAAACLTAPLTSCDWGDFGSTDIPETEAPAQPSADSTATGEPDYIFPDDQNGQPTADGDNMKMGYIEFDPQGGLGSIAVGQYRAGTTATLPKSGFEKAFCRLIGWSSTPGAEIPEYGLEGRYDVKSGLQKLYAVWEPITYTVSYDPNFNGCTVSLPAQTYLGGDLLQLPEVELGRGRDWNFLGWFDAKEGGAQVTSGTTVSKNLVLYAHYEFDPKVLQLSFDYQGGYGEVNHKELPAGDPLGALPIPAVRQGWRFSNWSMTDGTIVNAETVPEAKGELQLVAKWDLTTAASHSRAGLNVTVTELTSIFDINNEVVFPSLQSEFDLDALKAAGYRNARVVVQYHVDCIYTCYIQTYIAVGDTLRATDEKSQKIAEGKSYDLAFNSSYDLDMIRNGITLSFRANQNALVDYANKFKITSATITVTMER